MPKPNPVPGFVMHSPQSAQANVLNQNSIVRWTKTISPRMVAVDNPLWSETATAAPSPPCDNYLVEAGYQEVTFSGPNGSLTFPRPFPNGILWMQAAAGIITTPYLVYVLLPWTSADTQTANLAAYTVGGSPFSGNLTIIYQALGW